MAHALRRELDQQRVSFVFETVFSDPVDDKLAFLRDAAAARYTVVLCFIGISGPEISEQRFAMRVSQGGHDVPREKLATPCPRIVANLRSALQEVAHVWIFDNDDLRTPFRIIAVYENGQAIQWREPLPRWFKALRVKALRVLEK